MSRPVRISGLLLVVAIVVAACGGDTAVTTTTAPPATTTSTSTTTTTVPTEVEIPETAILKLRPGTTYVASEFWEPVSFTVEKNGWWWSQGASDLWVHVEYHENGESNWDLDVSLIAPDPGRGVDETVSEIVVDDRLVVAADPTATTVDGYDTIVLDGVGVVGQNPAGFPFDPCTHRGSSGNSRFDLVTDGFIMVSSESNAFLGWKFGVRECRAARIWVVDVDGSTIVIIAAAHNQALFDQLIPAAEDLIAGIEFHP